MPSTTTSTTLSTPTHTSYQNILVPRSVLVGNISSNTNYVYSSHGGTNDTAALASSSSASTIPEITTWSGTIETLSRHMILSSANENETEDGTPLLGVRSSSAISTGTSNYSYNSNPPPPLSRMNYGLYSRYRVESTHNPKKTHHSSSTYYQTTTHQDERHVNWDEEMLHKDEHDDDKDDDYYTHHNDHNEDDDRIQHDERQWQQEYQIAQHSMDEYWQSYYPSDAIPTTNRTASKTKSNDLTWYDYLQMSSYPYHPNTTLVDLQQSPIARLQSQYHPPSLSSSNVPNTTNPMEQDDMFPTGTNNITYYQALQEDTDFVETILWEQHIRTLLEQCDSCQGMMLLQDNHNGIYTGWGTNVLQLWNDECPHTVQFSIPVSCDSSSNSNNVHNEQMNQRNTVREYIQQSLLLSDQTLLSTVVLPLQLPHDMHPSPSSVSCHAAAAGAVAMALECSTLPFRIVDGSKDNSHAKARLALQSYYSSNSYQGSTGIPNLSYREFVRTLQRQSTSRNVLELDTILPWNTTNTLSATRSLLDILQQGTSIERDHRMKQSGYQSGIHRPADALPGDWMNTNVDSNILSSLSPTAGANAKTAKQNANDRNLHYHYALSTSLRPPSTNALTPKISKYVTSIMESMGIRYRPEQTLCTVLDQSYEDLLHTNGSYWKYIFRGCGIASKASLQPYGNLSVLGNTTRIYPYLVQTASNAQQIISPRNKKSMDRSIYNHDVTMGIVPEMDDYNEAVTTCLDIRDSYEPPHGSGLIVDEEGEYFDMS
jgi:hypothetical protein